MVMYMFKKYKIIYGIHYRVANFHRTWLWNVRGCDLPVAWSSPKVLMKASDQHIQYALSLYLNK